MIHNNLGLLPGGARRCGPGPPQYEAAIGIQKQLLDQQSK